MKRLKKRLAKPTIISSRKGIVVANCTPKDYLHTKRWAKFIDNGETYFKTNVPEKPDALCFALLDPLIDSEANLEKESLFQQRADHLALIEHDSGILRGFLEKYQEHKNNLQADLDRVKGELDQLRKIKEANEKEDE